MFGLLDLTSILVIFASVATVIYNIHIELKAPNEDKKISNTSRKG